MGKDTNGLNLGCPVPWKSSHAGGCRAAAGRRERQPGVASDRHKDVRAWALKPLHLLIRSWKPGGSLSVLPEHRLCPAKGQP